eukprot:TRINITY_DN1531_c0_g1_i1.p1 TRINITY_DN1531_c0_g1~~TRINITY_DN1531_c0_g1_i1.p1  ORF type:complete len:386 (-),score=89.02 TRINITY_DN1531_c0_g1_i1:346-1503(-)
MENTVVRVWQGRIIHSLVFEHVELIEDGRIGVNADGTILFVSRSSEEHKETEKKFGYGEELVVHLGQKFLIPGFVDTHAHAPQYVFSGTGTGLPLLEWLEKYTFNYESRFKELSVAQDVYSKGVKRHLHSGSTTVVYFGTIHLESTKLLVEIIEQLGQRAYVGKVNMDRNSPDKYRETTEGSIKDTEAFVEWSVARKSFQDGLVVPILTPRFVPTCTPELMTRLGEIAREHDLPIQSHISENKNEVKWVAELHPECTSYADVYDKYGLLSSKTIMAHAIHLEKEELQLFIEKQVAVSHCPLSNSTLGSGFLCVRDLVEAGIKVGLGSDVSGGYSPSMLSAIRNAMVAGAVHNVYGDKKLLDYQEAFYLATVGDASFFTFLPSIIA